MVKNRTRSFLKINSEKIQCEHCGKVAFYLNYKGRHVTKCRKGLE